MAQCNHEKEIIVKKATSIHSKAVIGGDNQANHLYGHLKKSMAQAKQIDIVVSFLMESGVRMILADLKEALETGCKIRILTGNYLGITQPSALWLIKNELENQVDLRMYNDSSRSFHPKAYIFHYQDDREIYVGSSNVSRSALTSGIEWNYRFRQSKDTASFEDFYKTFKNLFYHNSVVLTDGELTKYTQSWIKPAVTYTLNHYDYKSGDSSQAVYEPRGLRLKPCTL